MEHIKQERDNPILDKKEEKSKLELKRLTGEFLTKMEEVENHLVRFQEFFNKYRDEQKIEHEWLNHVKNNIIPAVQDGKLKDGKLELETDSNLPEIAKRYSEVEGSKLHIADRNTICTVVDNINQLMEEYGLRFRATIGMQSDEIKDGIYEAYYAKLWKLQNRIE